MSPNNCKSLRKIELFLIGVVACHGCDLHPKYDPERPQWFPHPSGDAFELQVINCSERKAVFLPTERNKAGKFVVHPMMDGGRSTDDPTKDDIENESYSISCAGNLSTGVISRFFTYHEPNGALLIIRADGKPTPISEIEELSGATESPLFVVNEFNQIVTVTTGGHEYHAQPNRISHLELETDTFGVRVGSGHPKNVFEWNACFTGEAPVLLINKKGKLVDPPKKT